MPYFIETNARFYYHEGSFKMDLELSRNIQLTNNLFFEVEVRGIAATKTIPQDEIGSGLNQMQYSLTPSYRLMPGMTAFLEYEHTVYHGPLKSILQRQGEATREDALFLGLNVVI